MAAVIRGAALAVMVAIIAVFWNASITVQEGTIRAGHITLRTVYVHPLLHALQDWTIIPVVLLAGLIIFWRHR